MLFVKDVQNGTIVYQKQVLPAVLDQTSANEKPCYAVMSDFRP